MPIYLFKNESTGEVHEVVYHMNDDKNYRGPKNTDKEGVWKRVWIKPQMGVDMVRVDPYSSSDFVKATNKKGTVGDLWDRSAELSAKRAEKEGLDPVKEKFFQDYSAKRHGKKHPEQQRRERDAALKKKGITITGLDED